MPPKADGGYLLDDSEVSEEAAIAFFEEEGEEAGMSLKAMTEAMGEHIKDCPECQEKVREHMGEGKGLDLSGAVRAAIEQAFEEVNHGG